MAVIIYRKIWYDQNFRVFRVKFFLFCFNLFFIFYSYFPERFDSHVSLFCFFSISGIAPLITCFDLRFKNIFRKFTTALM